MILDDLIEELEHMRDAIGHSGASVGASNSTSGMMEIESVEAKMSDQPRWVLIRCSEGERDE